MAKDGGFKGLTGPLQADWWQASDGLWYPPQAPGAPDRLSHLPPPPTGWGFTGPTYTRRQRWIAVTVVFVVVALGLALSVGKEASRTSRSTSVLDQMKDAWYGCTHAVTNRLKAPSTADFPRYSQISVVGSGNVFSTSSYVDSENGFGANIRTNFTCTATHREATKDWYFTTSLD